MSTSQLDKMEHEELTYYVVAVCFGGDKGQITTCRESDRQAWCEGVHREGRYP